jgi:hypothetical protein
MVAAGRFLSALRAPGASNLMRITVTLHGRWHTQAKVMERIAP